MAMATAIATNQLGVMKSVRKSDGRSASERWRAKRGKDCRCCVLQSRAIELKPKEREALAHPIVGMVCQGLLKTIALGTCALRYISWHKDCLTPVTGDPRDGALASGVVSKKGS